VSSVSTSVSLPSTLPLTGFGRRVFAHRVEVGDGDGPVMVPWTVMVSVVDEVAP